MTIEASNEKAEELKRKGSMGGNAKMCAGKNGWATIRRKRVQKRIYSEEGVKDRRDRRLWEFPGTLASAVLIARAESAILRKTNVPPNVAQISEIFRRAIEHAEKSHGEFLHLGFMDEADV